MNIFRCSVQALSAGLLAGLLAACGGGGTSGSGGLYGGGGGIGGGSTGGKAYGLTKLVSDGSGTPYTDPSLINGWGIAFNPQGFVWVSDAGTSKSTLYDGNGVPQSLVVSIPPASIGPAVPTGIDFNGSQDFKVTQGGFTGASPFIFVGATGTIAGWSPVVNMTNVVQMFGGGAASKSYTGVTLGTQNGANFLYAADIHNAAVDVYNGTFAVAPSAGGFKGPNPPAGYAPFGIQAMGNQVYAAYGQQDPQGLKSKNGPGLGLVDVFDGAGYFVKRPISGGALNAPWGMTMAPMGFGPFAGALLVGNFGDGKIDACDPASGALLGTLSDAAGQPLGIDGCGASPSPTV